MKNKGYLFGLSAVAIWTGFILVSRQGGLGPLNANDVIAIRYFTCSVILLPFWFFYQRFNFMQWKFVVAALIGGLAYALCAFRGFQMAPASHAAVLMPGTLPILTILFAWLINQERFQWSKWLGVLVICSGIAALLLPVIQQSGGLNWGHVWFVAAAACWALFTILVKRWGISPWQATISLAFVTGLFYLPVYWVWLPKNIFVAPWHDIALQAVYQGFLATVVQMFCYMNAIRLIGPTNMGSLMALVPVMAGLSALVLFNEPLTAGLISALALVSLGTWITHTGWFEKWNTGTLLRN